MNEESFEQLANSFIQPFANYGFRMVGVEYWPNDFGNALATFAGDFRLRLVSDKGQLFVEVASAEDPDNWYDLRVVFEFLGDTIDMQAVDAAAIERLKVRLESKYETIRSLFDRDNFASTKPRLEQYRNQRISRMFSLG